MTSHRHPAKRCDTCEFWARGDQFPWDENSKAHPDDRTAACHRNAPRPSIGDFEYMVLQLLHAIAWDHMDEEIQKVTAENWEEAYLQECVWPSTTGSDWCGEWSPKTYTDEPETE